MAKLIVSHHGEIIESRFLDQPCVTIGSLPASDLCLTAKGISRSHARISTVGNDDILEDLGSTNGTLVNGKPVTRHILQNDDVIDIAGYHIRYRNLKAVGGPSFDKTMIVQGLAPEEGQSSQAVGAFALATAKKARRFAEGARVGLVRVIAGTQPGQEIELQQILRTFGQPGRQLAVINHRPLGYFITHVEGKESARLNGKPIGLEPQALAPDDVIEVGGERLLFLLK